MKMLNVQSSSMVNRHNGGNISETGQFVMLFTLFLEFVMADLNSVCKEFMLDAFLSFDIRYTNDVTLMSSVFEKQQMSTEKVQMANGA